jgi:hypothetical protein
MLQSARADALEQLQRSTMIYHPVGPEWRPFGNARRKRDIESVVLDDGVAERLLGDVHEFINNAQWCVCAYVHVNIHTCAGTRHAAFPTVVVIYCTARLDAAKAHSSVHLLVISTIPYAF